MPIIPGSREAVGARDAHVLAGPRKAVVDPGVNGELYEVGDVDALVRLVAGILDDPARRDAMGRAARKTIRAHCSRERVTDINSRLLLKAG